MMSSLLGGSSGGSVCSVAPHVSSCGSRGVKPRAFFSSAEPLNEGIRHSASGVSVQGTKERTCQVSTIGERAYSEGVESLSICVILEKLDVVCEASGGAIKINEVGETARCGV